MRYLVIVNTQNDAGIGGMHMVEQCDIDDHLHMLDGNDADTVLKKSVLGKGNHTNRVVLGAAIKAVEQIVPRNGLVFWIVRKPNGSEHRTIKRKNYSIQVFAPGEGGTLDTVAANIMKHRV